MTVDRLICPKMIATGRTDARWTDARWTDARWTDARWTDASERRILRKASTTKETG
jgi:hypothetical protein